MQTSFIPIDHAAFDRLTPDARYWVGFLMADGCLTLAKRVRKNGKTVFYKMIALSLSAKDKAHVKRFREFLKSKHKITVYTYDTSFGRTTQARLAFISPSIWERLRALGIKPRKTEGCSIDSSLAFDRDFWRGVIDGDGSVLLANSKHSKRQAIIRLNGCLQLLNQFQAYVTAVTGNTYKISIHPTVKNFGELKLGSKPAQQLISTLYANASIALTRKLKKAQQIGNYYHEH